MKSISFKNFRRFADFPEFKFGDITILVGGNNAGKSTLVKALLLVLDNLKTMRREINLGETTNIFKVLSSPEFRFDENKFHELNIKNFSRALNRHCDKNDAITFNLTVEHPVTEDTYEFDIVVSRYNSESGSGSNDDARGLIDLIKVANITKGICLEFSFSSTKRAPYMYVRIPDAKAKELAEQAESLESQRKELQDYIKTWEDRYNSMEDDSMFLGEVSKLNDRKIELKKIEKVLSDVLTKQKTAKDVEVKLPIANTLNQASPYLILDLINDIISYSHYGSSEKKGSKAYNQEMREKDLLKAQLKVLDEMKLDIRSLLEGFNVDYIQAHGVTQRTLFSSSDEADHIAMTIKDFMQSRAWRNDEIQSFIQDWMRKLNIGYNYAITDLDGEAFKVSIFESPEDTKGFPLADLGMGSIQLMMLLFALASSIKRNYGSIFGKPTVVIEEPEQNLHPAFQSELADILYHVNKKFGLKFIVETHSEYMIRRTQVIVAQLGAANEKELAKQNPFRVYYFPKDGTPYDMKYREDGRFAEEFGSGFFDEASNLAISLF
jgi:predicted ATPase